MNIFSNATNALVTISGSIFVLAIMVCGIMIAVKTNRGDGFRESVQSLGKVMFGIIVTSGATALYGLGKYIAGLL